MKKSQTNNVLRLPTFILVKDIFFPGITTTLFFKGNLAIGKVIGSLKKDKPLALFWRKKGEKEAQPIGIKARILKLSRFAGRYYQLLLEAEERVSLISRNEQGMGLVELSGQRDMATAISAKLEGQLAESFKRWIFLNQKVADNLLNVLSFINHPGATSDLFAHYFLGSYQQKLEILQLSDLEQRVKTITSLLNKDILMLEREWTKPLNKTNSVNGNFIH